MFQRKTPQLYQKPKFQNALLIYLQPTAQSSSFVELGIYGHYYLVINAIFLTRYNPAHSITALGTRILHTQLAPTPTPTRATPTQTSLYKYATSFISSTPTFSNNILFFSLPHKMAISNLTMLLLSIFVASFFTATADFYQDAEISWGQGRGKILEGGRVLTLSLDQDSGSGFQSRNEYLLGRFDVQLKLVPGNSAGTVTTFFLSSQGAGHDEIDFEFLGNSSGEPYTVHTNVYAQGKGDKEQQFRLWFDPTLAFHTYSIVWNSQRIIFLVDNIPLRVFNNNEAIGTPYPKSQAMKVYCSLWNADDWATQGGRVKTDWTKAPFVATYQNFNIDSSKPGDSLNNNQAWQTQALDANGRNRLRWVQQNYMIYNYCTDTMRFPKGIPAECKSSRF